MLSDIWVSEERNGPMALFSGAVLFGTGLGPLFSGPIVQHVSWRWIFYAQAIASAIVTVIIVAFLKETRGSVLLSRKAKVLNKYYEQLEEAGYGGFDLAIPGTEKVLQNQRIRWKVKSDEERASLMKMISISVYRPFRKFKRKKKQDHSDSIHLSIYLVVWLTLFSDLLFTEPVVFFFSLWVSFSWAVLYLQFAAIPLVFSVRYGFNVEETGAVFSGMFLQ